RHFDRYRLERREERRTAQRTAAGAVAPDHLRFVPHTDLPHLDARVELSRQLTYELPKIHSAFGGEIENEPCAVERLLGLRELHSQATLPNLQRRNPMRIALTLLVLQPQDDIVV